MVQAITLITAAVIALTALAVDLLSYAVDPRVRKRGCCVKRLPLTPVLCAIPLVAIVVFAVAGSWLVPDATTQDIYSASPRPAPTGTSSAPTCWGATSWRPEHRRHALGRDRPHRHRARIDDARAWCSGTSPATSVAGLDLVLSKYADLLLALPVTLIALVVAGLIDGGYWVTVLVLVVLFSPTDIRLMRSAGPDAGHAPVHRVGARPAAQPVRGSCSGTSCPTCCPSPSPRCC